MASGDYPNLRLRDERATRAFIYDRNSRQGPGSTSVQDQGLENRRFCESRGWQVVAEFRDPGKSASRYSKTPRPDYEQMIRRVMAGECDVIVAWEASRATRNTRTYLDLRDLCERTGVLLCYNGREFDMARSDDRFATHIDALMAEREADAIRDRNLRTVRLNAERGRPHGRVPYGWRREYDPQTGALVGQLVDPQSAAVVLECAQRVAAGQSLYSVAKSMNARGVPGPMRGVEWTASTVRSLIERPSNIGKRQYRGQVVGDALWEGIVPDDLYYACLRVFADPGRPARRETAVKFLLSGIAVCGVCGPQERTLRPARSSKGIWSYTCLNCYGVSMRTSTLDDVVQIAVLEHVERPEFSAALALGDGRERVRHALAEAQALEGQLAAARELSVTVVDGRIALPAAEFTALAARLTPMIESARGRARDATVPTVLHRVAGAGAREVWEELSLPERRTVLRHVVQVSLNRAGRGRNALTPQRLTWEWLR